MAPLVRAVAWAMSFVTSVVVLVVAGAYAAGVDDRIVVWTFVYAPLALVAAGCLRFLAGSFRPAPLLLPQRDVPRA